MRTVSGRDVLSTRRSQLVVRGRLHRVLAVWGWKAGPPWNDRRGRRPLRRQLRPKCAGHSLLRMHRPEYLRRSSVPPLNIPATWSGAKEAGSGTLSRPKVTTPIPENTPHGSRSVLARVTKSSVKPCERPCSADDGHECEPAWAEFDLRRRSASERISCVHRFGPLPQHEETSASGIRPRSDALTTRRHSTFETWSSTSRRTRDIETACMKSAKARGSMPLASHPRSWTALAILSMASMCVMCRSTTPVRLPGLAAIDPMISKRRPRTVAHRGSSLRQSTSSTLSMNSPMVADPVK